MCAWASPSNGEISPHFFWSHAAVAPSMYGDAITPSLYGAAVTPSLYGAAVTPSLYGAAVTPSLYGAAAPSLYGATVAPSSYGATVFPGSLRKSPPVPSYWPTSSIIPQTVTWQPPLSSLPHAQDISCALATSASNNNLPAKVSGPRFGSGDPTNWISKFEMFLEYKNVNPLDYVFMASLYLDLPASKWCLEFLQNDMGHDWHHFKVAIQNRFGIGVPPLAIILDSHDTASEEHEPCGTLEGPISVQAPIIHVGREMLPSILLEDTHLKPSPPLEEIQNISNTILDGSNSFNIVLEGSCNLFDLSNNSDSHDNTSVEKLCVFDEVVTLASSASPLGTLGIQNVYIPFVVHNFGFRTLDSTLLKAPPPFILSIHEASTWTLWVFDPGGFKFSFAVFTPREFFHPFFSTNKELFSTPIFIFDPGGSKFFFWN